MLTGSTDMLIRLLIDVVVFGVIAAIVFWIINMIPMPALWKNIAMALLGLIFLLIVLSLLGWHV